MEKDIDVIVVGELNVDLILNQIDSFPEMGKEKLAREMTLTLGSSSAIFASNLRSLGAGVSFLGKIGEDIFGDLVIGSLQDKGVNTEYIIRSTELKTGATIVLNFAEDRAMVTHAGAMESLTIEDISDVVLNKAKHLHFSSYFLQPGLKNNIVDLFKKSKAFGLTTSFDAQWDPDEKWDLDLKSVLPYIDVFLPNEQEILHLTGKENLDDAVNAVIPYANLIVVKRGNKGSVVFSESLKRVKEAFLNRNVVDAIGAGDSFNAGFIYKFIQKCSLEQCQEFGNLAGAISTTAPGGTAAFIDYDTVINIGRDRFGYSGN